MYGLKECEDIKQVYFLSFREGSLHVSLSIGLKLQDLFIPRSLTCFPHHYFKIEIVFSLKLMFNPESCDVSLVLNVSIFLVF